MADGTLLNTGTGGDTLATDELTTLNGSAAPSSPSHKVQRTKIGYGVDGDLRDVSLSFPLPVKPYDAELGLAAGFTGLRDQLFAQRHTVLSDSLADGLAAFWTATTANGGTATSSGGEGLIQTSAAATGSAQISSGVVSYHPGMVAWLNSAVRFNDTGSAGNTRRIGAFTISGTTPQNGFYYELSGTTLNAVVVSGGTPTATAVASWSEVATAPFTLDTNYHSFEIRFTANTVLFFIDNVLRHRVSGTSAAITATLNFPITIQSINASGATNRLIAVRNIGMGRFGEPEGYEAVAHGANPTATQVGQRSKLITNRHGVPFVIGGHPNIQTVRLQFTAAQTNTSVISVSAGTKIVVTSFQVTLDNASTVFPLVRMGFGAAATPTTTGVIGAHGGLPAGGGFGRGDGSGIIGIGADGEDLFITTVGAATGNGVEVVVTYYTIES